MTKRTRELTGEEKRLWRQVAKGLKLRRAPPAGDEEEAPAPAPAPKTRPEPPKTPAPRREPKRGIAERSGERKVRRGQVEIGAALDLHGHTYASARAALARFLIAAQARGERVVIVVTGVGRGGAGVLKQALPEWLAQPDLRPLTSGYAQAHRKHGGAGAYYVFLKKAKN